MVNEVSIVVPAHCEGRHVGDSVRRLLETLDQDNIPSKVIIVLDGPDLEARASIEQISDCRLEILELAVPSGKGAALKAGCSRSESMFTAFFDADLDIHPKSLVECIHKLAFLSDEVVCVYGSKHHPESRIEYPAIRRFCSRALHLLIQILFKVECKDSQTGVKVFRTSELNKVIRFSRENRFLFDLEILALLSNCGGRLVDMPVEITYQYTTSINLFSAAQILFDVFTLRVRLIRQLRLVRS